MTDTSPPPTLVTVTSRSFLPGTRVMLDSFLRHNRWFKGYITVIHTDLRDDDQAGLALAFPNLEFRHPPTPLLDALTKLSAARSHLKTRVARFYSLGLFWLAYESDILFCDGDIVFTGDVSPLFQQSGGFLAAPDAATLEGKYRDPVTMAEMLPSERVSDHRSFNAGLMLLRREMKWQNFRPAILTALEPEGWSSIRSNHTDQAVLYHLLGESVTLLDPRFNQLVGHAARLRKAGCFSITDSLAFHFNGPCKPWRIEAHSDGANRDGFFVGALKAWFDAHIRYLARRHLMLQPVDGDIPSIGPA